MTIRNLFRTVDRDLEEDLGQQLSVIVPEPEAPTTPLQDMTKRVQRTLSRLELDAARLRGEIAERQELLRQAEVGLAAFASAEMIMLEGEAQ